MDAEKFCAQFLPDAIPADFSALEIPLTVMATDLHRRAGSGNFVRTAACRRSPPRSPFPACSGRSAIDGRVMVDGGATNPLPFDQLRGLADVIVAVDVFGIPAPERSDMPGAWESMFTTLLVMGAAIVAAKHKHAAPDLVIRPNVAIFRTLRFLSGERDHPLRRSGEGRR